MQPHLKEASGVTTGVRTALTAGPPLAALTGCGHIGLTSFSVAVVVLSLYKETHIAYTPYVAYDVYVDETKNY